MARISGIVNSATNQWFFNLADNSALDSVDEGFTVFGQVLGTGMVDVVDQIAALPVSNQLNVFPAFGDLPVINYDEATRPPLVQENLVRVTNIPNVVSFLGPVSNGAMVLAARANQTIQVFAIDTATSLDFLRSFSPNANEIVNFDREIVVMIVDDGVPGFTSTVTALYGPFFRPNRYYAFGPTPGNPLDHWYDFSFDGETGAEITPNGIYLHFVEGKRGDNDPDTSDGSIVHVGTPAVVTPTAPSASITSGCAMSRQPPNMANAGAWYIVALFLAVAAWRRTGNKIS
jgi:hypothetical protein